ncbi:hypothetical protein CRG98_003953 [Punica granatum]|uniref:Uncharacterized protein n=1 Tax=Punica granatum TaxID=22663 RepID=A0A2I0L4X5_PUNGR|nr:hypothetical protein CRG98_003953 [Punica granatum]
MARLSSVTRSLIGSTTELNRPRRILPQAQRATKHAIQAVQDIQHQSKDGREGKFPMRVTNTAALRHPDEKGPKLTGASNIR